MAASEVRRLQETNNASGESAPGSNQTMGTADSPAARKSLAGKLRTGPDRHKRDTYDNIAPKAAGVLTRSSPPMVIMLGIQRRVRQMG